MRSIANLLRPAFRDAVRLKPNFWSADNYRFFLWDPHEMPAQLRQYGANRRHGNSITQQLRTHIHFGFDPKYALLFNNSQTQTLLNAAMPDMTDIFHGEIWVNLNYVDQRMTTFYNSGGASFLNYLVPWPGHIKYREGKYNEHYANPNNVTLSEFMEGFQHLLAYNDSMVNNAMPWYRRTLDPRFARWGRRKVFRFKPTVTAALQWPAYDADPPHAPNTLHHAQFFYRPVAKSMGLKLRKRRIFYHPVSYSAEELAPENIPAQVRTPLWQTMSKPTKRGWKRYIIIAVTNAADDSVPITLTQMTPLNIEHIAELLWRSDIPFVNDVR